MAVIIELLGAPGAGKTSLVPALETYFGSRGQVVFTLDNAARPFAARSNLGRALGAVVPARLESKAMWATYRLIGGWHSLRFVLANPTLTIRVVRSQFRRPADADASKRRVLYWYFRMAGAYGYAREFAKPDEVVLVDEGFAHRAVQLFASEVETPSQDQVDAYVSELPRPAMAIYVSAPADVCVSRVRQRGAWDRFADRDPTELDRFVHSAHRTIGMVRDALEREGWPLVDIANGDASPDAIAVAEELAEAFKPDRMQSASMTKGAIPRLLVPKPSRCADWVRGLRQPPSIAADDVAAVLEAYGARQVGEAAKLPMSWRNDSVVVPTSAGAMVLKRYRAATPPEAVVHEHSIMEQLAKSTVAAVRIERTAKGATFVSREGRLYVLSPFIDAHQFASSVLSSRQRRSLLSRAGGVLASFHDELRDFYPAGRHHLGLDPASGQPRSDLTWYLDTVHALSTDATAQRDDAVGERLTWLRRQTDSIVRGLNDIVPLVESAALPTTVIHGDYGIHNLLFRRPDTVVVHDFELSRRDWRLLDLVSTVGRLRDVDHEAFLSSYRANNDLTPTELELWPIMFRYQLLTGAVRSWNGFVHRGGINRLDTARARLEQFNASDGRLAAVTPRS